MVTKGTAASNVSALFCFFFSSFFWGGGGVGRRRTWKSGLTRRRTTVQPVATMGTCASVICMALLRRQRALRAPLKY